MKIGGCLYLEAIQNDIAPIFYPQHPLSLLFDYVDLINELAKYYIGSTFELVLQECHDFLNDLDNNLESPIKKPYKERLSS